MMVEHRKNLYDCKTWANGTANRGYAVLATAAFPFDSRKDLLKDIPASQRQGFSDPDKKGLSVKTELHLLNTFK